jgi:hypothetical protein
MPPVGEEHERRDPTQVAASNPPMIERTESVIRRSARGAIPPAHACLL